MIELQRCENKDEWDEYILENGGHPLQLWSWGQVKTAHGWKAQRVFAFDEAGEVVGAVQILIRPLPYPFKSFAYVPRGPLFESEDQDLRNAYFAALAAFIKRDYGSVTLSIEPDSPTFNTPENWVHTTNMVLPAETILLDIRKAESELLADMAKKTRQYIRKSATEVTIRQAKTVGDIDDCLRIYSDTAKRAGFNLHDPHYYKDVFSQMKDYSPVFMAYVGEEPVAFLWLAISESTAYELYGGVSELGQEVRANYALKWHAIRKVKEWGLTRYDFGGLVAGGVSNFKQGWSLEITVFPGTFDAPLSRMYKVWTSVLPSVKKTLQKLRSRT